MDGALIQNGGRGMKPLRNKLESCLMLIIFSLISRRHNLGLCGLVRGGECYEFHVISCSRCSWSAPSKPQAPPKTQLAL